MKSLLPGQNLSPAPVTQQTRPRSVCTGWQAAAGHIDTFPTGTFLPPTPTTSPTGLTRGGQPPPGAAPRRHTTGHGARKGRSDMTAPGVGAKQSLNFVDSSSMGTTPPRVWKAGQKPTGSAALLRFCAANVGLHPHLEVGLLTARQSWARGAWQ